MIDQQLIRMALLLKKLREIKFASLMKTYDLRGIELEILDFLCHERERKNAKDIIQAKKISKAHISKSLENLRVRGCIVLHEEATDRRKVQITLTDKGKDIASEVHLIHEELERCLWESIHEEDIKKFEDILGELCDNLLHELEKEDIKI